VDYSAIKSDLKKNNIHYLTSPNSEKPMKGVNHHLPPGMPVKDIFSILQELGFNIINMRQMMAT
jgi:hypothetical protein